MIGTITEIFNNYENSVTPLSLHIKLHYQEKEYSQKAKLLFDDVQNNMLAL